MCVPTFEPSVMCSYRCPRDVVMNRMMLKLSRNSAVLRTLHNLIEFSMVLIHNRLLSPRLYPPSASVHRDRLRSDRNQSRSSLLPSASAAIIDALPPSTTPLCLRTRRGEEYTTTCIQRTLLPHHLHQHEGAAGHQETLSELTVLALLPQALLLSPLLPSLRGLENRHERLNQGRRIEEEENKRK